MNFAGKVSLTIPFVAAVVGAVTARFDHAGGLATAGAGAVGFLVGFCFGALTVGLSNALLSSGRRLSDVGAVGLGLAYLLLPVASLAAASTTAFYVVRWLF